MEKVVARGCKTDKEFALIGLIVVAVDRQCPGGVAAPSPGATVACALHQGFHLRCSGRGLAVLGFTVPMPVRKATRDIGQAGIQHSIDAGCAAILIVTCPYHCPYHRSRR